MLIDPPLSALDSPTSKILSLIAGERDEEIRRIDLGLYEIGHWSFEMYLSGKWDQYPDLGQFGAYGVCDSPKQFLEVLGLTLQDPNRLFVVSFVRLSRETQPPEGGWRWHKWGEYIGKQDPQCEYLHDEPVITEVYTYHVYEKVTNSR